MLLGAVSTSHSERNNLISEMLKCCSERKTVCLGCVGMWDSPAMCFHLLRLWMAWFSVQPAKPLARLTSQAVLIVLTASVRTQHLLQALAAPVEVRCCQTQQCLASLNLPLSRQLVAARPKTWPNTILYSFQQTLCFSEENVLLVCTEKQFALTGPV